MSRNEIETRVSVLLSGTKGTTRRVIVLNQPDNGQFVDKEAGRCVVSLKRLAPVQPAVGVTKCGQRKNLKVGALERRTRIVKLDPVCERQRRCGTRAGVRGPLTPLELVGRTYSINRVPEKDERVEAKSVAVIEWRPNLMTANGSNSRLRPKKGPELRGFDGSL